MLNPKAIKIKLHFERLLKAFQDKTPLTQCVNILNEIPLEDRQYLKFTDGAIYDLNILHWAAYYERSGFIPYLINAGVEVDSVSPSDGITAVFVAAELNHPEVIKVLYKHKADINKLTQHTAPIYVAAKKGNTQAVQALLACGADIRPARYLGAEDELLWVTAADNLHFNIVGLLLKYNIQKEVYKDNKITRILLDLSNFDSKSISEWIDSVPLNPSLTTVYIFWEKEEHQKHAQQILTLLLEQKNKNVSIKLLNKDLNAQTRTLMHNINVLRQGTMTPENVITAVDKLHCMLLGDYIYENLITVELEDARGVPLLSFYSKDSLAQWITLNNVPFRDPRTTILISKVPTLRSAKQLFALTVASAVAVGYYDVLKRTDGFEAFVNTPSYQLALADGQKILASLKVASGTTLKEKLLSLNLEEIKCTPGEMYFLEKVLCLDLHQIDNPGVMEKSLEQKYDDNMLAKILTVQIPKRLPSIAVQYLWKQKVLDEIRANTYIGKGYPLGRGLQNRNEQRAMSFIQHIYHPAVLLALLDEVLQLADVKKNVSCITVELTSKILGLYLEEQCSMGEIYQAIGYLFPIMQKIPGWSKQNEDSLRPYIQTVEQLFGGSRIDQQKFLHLFVTFHSLKNEMLRIHPVFPKSDTVKIKGKDTELVLINGEKMIKPKMQGLIEYIEIMLSHVFHKHMAVINPTLLKTVVKELLEIPISPKDAIGLLRIEKLFSRIPEDKELAEQREEFQAQLQKEKLGQTVEAIIAPLEDELLKFKNAPPILCGPVPSSSACSSNLPNQHAAAQPNTIRPS